MRITRLAGANISIYPIGKISVNQRNDLFEPHRPFLGCLPFRPQSLLRPLTSGCDQKNKAVRLLRDVQETNGRMET